MSLQRAITAGALMAGLSAGGQFKCGALRTSQDIVVLNIPHPPDALIKAKNLRTQWESAGAFPRAEQLRQFIEQGLNKEFGFGDANPDATLRLALLSFEPVREQRSTQNETRSIKVGEKPIYDKNGKQTGKQDIFENRVVPVEYWEGNGSLKINVTVADKTGVTIDAFAPTGVFHSKQEISVMGESRLGRASLPTPAAIESMLMSQIATQMRRRYTATFDPVRVMLACDNDLRNANKLAQAGQWKEALDGWKAVSLKKNGADQTFNIAVATEAVAYAEYARTQNLEDMLPHFTSAMKLYDQALAADPQEKYMREQLDRLQKAQRNIENVRKQYELQKVEAEKAEREAQKAIEAQQAEQRRQAERENAVKDTSPDSPEELRFRPLARSRIAAIQGEATEAQLIEIAGFGQRTFQLSEIRSYRVTAQEAERKKTLGQKWNDYDEMVRAFVADGKLSLTERTQLRELQKMLGLEDAEVRASESKYTYKEESRPTVAPQPAVTTQTSKTGKEQPKPTKAATPAAKPAAGTTPASTPKPGIGSTPAKPGEKKP